MPKIKVLPHAEICPNGAEFEAESGISVCENLLNQDIDIEHACELSCACTTCHVIFTEGFNSLNESSDDEEDLLDKAWGQNIYVEIRTVDVHVRRLRRAINIDGKPDLIRTVRGSGYALDFSPG